MIKLEQASLWVPSAIQKSFGLRKQLSHLFSRRRKIVHHHEQLLTPILQDVSFRLEHGDRVGVIGDNGAGKSSLLRLLAGIYTPTSGIVIVEGSVGVFLEIGIGSEPELSGYDNIRRLGLLQNWPKKHFQQYIRQAAEFSGLEDRLDRPIRGYSTGMLMRLIFSTVTVVPRDILLIDEMLSVGDGEFQERAKQRVLNLIDKSKILVFASHDKKILAQLCNRFFCMESGKMIEISVETFKESFQDN